MTKESYKTDIAVALIFFNRPNCLKDTFAAIAKSRPSRLYLIQDGPRQNKPDDIERIGQCRKIVENIDWDCEVHQLYSDTNLGCGMRVYGGISEVFETEEKLVIIEDDIVIGESFLPFCKEMLDRYENDERIGMISGMNHLGKYEACPYDYFFTSQGGAIWGWATWRRVWKDMDWKLDCAEDKYACRCVSRNLRPKSFSKVIMGFLKEKRASILRGEKQTSWSFQFGFPTSFMQSRLNIVPKLNQISNIGFSAESVHSSDLEKMPRGLRKVYNGKRFNIEFPLYHPVHIVDDNIYAEEQGKVLGSGFWRSIYRYCEAFTYRFIPVLGK